MKLGTNQSAEPDQCGSCQHFKHRQEKYDTFGVCSLKMPPWVHKMYANPATVWEVDPHTVRDTDTCDFYKPKNVAGEPVEIIQERKWKAGFPSR